jgi:hypothetical protein
MLFTMCSPETCHASITHYSTSLPGVIPVTYHYTCHVSYDPTTVPSTCCMTLPRPSYGCAMCHPCSGDTCHTLIGPPVPIHVNIHVPFHIICMTIQPVQSIAMWHWMDYTINIFLHVWENEQTSIT